MLKRLLFIGVCFCLVALVAFDAAAKVRKWNSNLFCSSVCLNCLLTGVGNPEQTDVAVCGGFYVEEVTGQCWNKPENATKSNGTAFFPRLNLIQSAEVTSQDLTEERGSAEVNICWDGEPEEVFGSAVWDWIQDNIDCNGGIEDPIEYCNDTNYAYCSGEGICPNPNWWFDPCSWQISKMYVYHAAYQEKNGTMQIGSGATCRMCVPDPENPEAECGYTCTDVKMSECEDRGLVSECLDDVNSTP